jgi:hypothetical protein
MTSWCHAHNHWTHNKVRRGECTEDEYPEQIFEPVYCDCPVYVAQPIPLFQASQCAVCGRTQRPTGLTDRA